VTTDCACPTMDRQPSRANTWHSPAHVLWDRSMVSCRVHGPSAWSKRYGPGSQSRAGPSRRVPLEIVATGDCAVGGGIFSESYAVVGGVKEVVPVDLHIRGCPPSPTQLLEGLLALLEQR
jgi:NADH ubiquinone oxidoreductase, 20 Kd subunit